LWNRRLFGIFVLLWFLELLWRIWTTGSVASPFSSDGVLRPCRWEDLTKVDHAEESTEVIEAHPPVAITLELVVQLFLQALEVVPCFIFIAELASPVT
jgi:hypothetical protein